ncbi:MAG: hypothetical protein RR755_01625 [Erysipelotrichaceae bacterium]
MIRTKNNKVIKERWGLFFIFLLLDIIGMGLAYYCSQANQQTFYYICLIVGAILIVISLILLIINIDQHRILKEHDRELNFELKKQGGRICPRCGAHVGLNDCACNSCGRKLK